MREILISHDIVINMVSDNDFFIKRIRTDKIIWNIQQDDYNVTN